MCLCVIFSSTSSSSSITIFFSRAVLYCTELLCVLDVCLCLCVCGRDCTVGCILSRGIATGAAVLSFLADLTLSLSAKENVMRPVDGWC